MAPWPSSEMILYRPSVAIIGARLLLRHARGRRCPRFVLGRLVLRLLRREIALRLRLGRREGPGPRRVPRLGRRQVEVGIDLVDPDEGRAAHREPVLEAQAEGGELERAHPVGLLLEAFLE